MRSSRSAVAALVIGIGALGGCAVLLGDFEVGGASGDDAGGGVDARDERSADTFPDAGGGADGRAEAGAADADAGVAANPNDIMQISAGGLTACARTRDGQVYCWGNNDFGQIGDGTTTTRTRATRVVGDTIAPFGNVVDVSVGGFHVCARDVYDAIYCWGGGDIGQLGNGRANTNDAATSQYWSLHPARVPFPAGAALAAGLLHTCAANDPKRDSGLDVICWGMNVAGELGHGSGTTGDVVATLGPGGLLWQANPSPRLAASAAFRGLRRFSLGASFGCASASDGTAWCWGSNNQLCSGDPSIPENGANPDPVQVHGLNDAGVLSGIAEVAAGGSSHACARTTAGAVICWGSNDHGELGPGAPLAAPSLAVRVPTPTAKQIASSEGTSCAVLASGNVACWGSNATGQLGHPPQTDPRCGSDACNAGPDTVKGATGAPLADVDTIAMGGFFACALKTDRTVWCWGEGKGGQLGNDALADSNVPVQVKGLP